MSNVHKLPVRVRASASGYIDPDKLYEVLPTASTVVITFSKEAEMQRYRRMLYTINHQGEFRYRTLRDEYSMWGIVVWRMK